MDKIGAIKDRVKASTNPYREYSICEISGIDIKNPLHEAWRAGYEARDMKDKVICDHAGDYTSTKDCEHIKGHYPSYHINCNNYR